MDSSAKFQCLKFSIYCIFLISCLMISGYEGREIGQRNLNHQNSRRNVLQKKTVTKDTQETDIGINRCLGKECAIENEDELSPRRSVGHIPRHRRKHRRRQNDRRQHDTNPQHNTGSSQHQHTSSRKRQQHRPNRRSGYRRSSSSRVHDGKRLKEHLSNTEETYHPKSHHRHLPRTEAVDLEHSQRRLNTEKTDDEITINEGNFHQRQRTHFKVPLHAAESPGRQFSSFDNQNKAKNERMQSNPYYFNSRGRNQRYGYGQRAPAAAYRLEQRLRPQLSVAVRELKDNMKNILQLMQNKVTKIQNNFGTINSDARHDIFEVKKQLQSIHDENNRAYDALLDVTQLVRFVHLRAYEGRVAPVSMRSTPNLYFRDFSRDVMIADQKASEAQSLASYVQNLGSRCLEQEEKYATLLHKIESRNAREMMMDVDRYRRQIERRLYGKIRSDVKHRIHTYRHYLDGLTDHYMDARNYSYMSFKEIRAVRKDAEKNIALRNAVLGMEPLPTLNSTDFSVTPSNRIEIERMTTRAYQHTRQLERRVEDMARYLIPVVQKAKQYLERRHKSGTFIKYEVQAVVKRLSNVVKKIDRKMDELRIFLGDEEILKERCEDLFTESGWAGDDEDTLIDCEQYIEEIGSGSGGEDLMTVHVTSPKPVPTSKPVSTHKLATTPKLVTTSKPVTTGKRKSTSFPRTSTSQKQPETSPEPATTPKPVTTHKPGKITSTSAPRTTTQRQDISSTSVLVSTTEDDLSEFIIDDVSPSLMTTTTPPPTTLPTTQATTTTVRTTSESIPTTFPTTATTTTQATSTIETGSGTEDPDFVFTETKESSYWDWFGDDPNAGVPSYLFKDKLNTRAENEREISVQLFDRSITIGNRHDAMMERWDIVQRDVETTNNFVGNASELQSIWTYTKPEIEETKNRIAKINVKINKQNDIILNKTQRALQIAQDAMEKVQSTQNGKDTAHNDAGMMTDLLVKVEKVQSNIQSIRELKDVNLQPCVSIQSAATNIRNNIAELRKKIDLARLITAAIPRTVALTEDDTITVQVPTTSVTETPMTSFEMCVKPERSDMMVASFQDNGSVAYDLSIEENVPVLKVTNEEGQQHGLVRSSVSLEHSEWYKLRVTRTGHTLEIHTSPMGNDTDTITEAAAFPDMSAMQKVPTIVHIGESRNDDDDISGFTGCLGDVFLNGKTVGISHTTRKGQVLPSCLNGCTSPTVPSMVFSGDGYVKFPLSTILPNYRLDSLQLRFSTRQKGGILLFLNDQQQYMQMLISVSEGSIHMEARTKRGTTVLRSTNNTYADGSSHLIEVNVQTNEVEAILDGVAESFAPETSTQEITSRLDDAIYVGGLGLSSQIIAGKTKLRSLTGCISMLKINNRDIPMYTLQESKNIALGSCQDSVWFHCARFTDVSKPVNLGKQTESNRMYLTVSTDAVGTLLNYKRKDKFDLEITVDSSGLEVIENIQGNDERLFTDAQHNDQWITVTVEDDDDSGNVRVGLNGTSVELPHKKAGWVFAGNNGPPEYELTVGGTIGDSDTATLTGSVARMIVNDVFIDLTSKTASNKLEGCTRQMLDLPDIEKVEKPVC